MSGLSYFEPMDELFFAPDLSHETITLGEEESRHCLQVKRHVVGDVLTLFDGRGKRARAELIDATRGACAVRILGREEVQRAANMATVTIATALTKNTSRIEWFVEKATELGISRITLMNCERSERQSVKLERLDKIALQAAKQSLNFWIPEIVGVVDFADALNIEAAERFIALQSANKTLQQQYANSGDALVLIGPEGDFTQAEEAMTAEKGFKPAQLASARLRTETAALVALHTITLTHA